VINLTKLSNTGIKNKEHLLWECNEKYEDPSAAMSILVEGSIFKLVEFGFMFWESLSSQSFFFG
jgi:hypothetical protein